MQLTLLVSVKEVIGSIAFITLQCFLHGVEGVIGFMKKHHAIVDTTASCHKYQQFSISITNFPNGNQNWRPTMMKIARSKVGCI